jgi:hypothetical protein
MMNPKRIFLILAMVAMTFSAVSAQAQQRGYVGRRPATNEKKAINVPDFSIREASAQSGIADRDDSSPVGSWRATFTPALGDPIQFPPLPALFTFLSDGTLVETDGGALAPVEQTYGSPGHGIWRRIGDRRYEIKNIILVVNADGSLFLTGTIKLVIKISKDGNSFAGEGTYSFLDSDGNDFGTGAEEINGQRLKF